MMNQKDKRLTALLRLTLLLLMMAGADGAWGATGSATVKMTYVDGSNPTTSYGEIATGSTARAGYNSIGTQDGFPYVNLANSGWGCNWITFIEVDASAYMGRITNATLTAEVSGATDSKRTTT